MYTKTAFMSAWPVLGAAIAACTLFTGGVAAKDDAVTVSIQVSTQGLDVSEPRGAQKLYWRLQNAARVACTQGNRVGLAPSPDPEGCHVQVEVTPLRRFEDFATDVKKRLEQRLFGQGCQVGGRERPVQPSKSRPAIRLW